LLILHHAQSQNDRRFDPPKCNILCVNDNVNEMFEFIQIGIPR
jgi:hypothetical protein